MLEKSSPVASVPLQLNWIRAVEGIEMRLMRLLHSGTDDLMVKRVIRGKSIIGSEGELRMVLVAGKAS